MKKPITLSLALLFAMHALAQFTVPILENVPSSVKWKQVNSPNFRVLFSEGSDSLAQYAINTLETLYEPSTASLQTSPEKITVILQQKNAISNGFVTVGPRRSEYYGLPPQDYNFTGANTWIDMLAAHEHRHVVQFSKSKTGLNKMVYYLFGEDAYGALAHLAMPPWFWEGDAVGTETALTHSGRGRIANFSVPFKANLLEKGPFSYDKQILSSFKDFVPDNYVSGYYLTTYLRRKYGEKVWDKVAGRAFSFPFLPWRLPCALKRETGMGLKAHYKGMMEELSAIWTNQLSELEATDATTINQRQNNAYTNYRYPQWDANGNVVALKSGIGDIPQFIMFDNAGNEKIMYVPGDLNDAGMLSIAGNKLVYIENEYSPRWRAASYSVIKIVDLQKKKADRITPKARYSSASLSPDGSLIAAIDNTLDLETFLVVLDATSGKEIKRFPNPENDFYQMPRWSDDGRSIVVLKISQQKKAIALVDFSTGNEDIVAPYVSENYGHPVKWGNYIFYNSAFNGIDNIYAIDLSTRQHFQVTSRKYGAYNPAVSADGRSIVFNDYTVNGMNVATMPLNPESWRAKNELIDRNDYYYKPLVDQEQSENLLLNRENKEYPVSPYKKINGLINPYAWGFYSDPSGSEYLLGLISQDILSTATISGGYQFDYYGDRNMWFGNISYQGLFPIIDVGFKSIARRESVIARGQVFNFDFYENVLFSGFRVPLLLTHSKYNEHLNLGTDISLGRFDFRNIEFQSRPRTDYAMLNYNFEYLRLLKRSKRDIHSRWGQYLFVQYSHLPFGGDFDGQQFVSQGELYLPGLFKHHSIRLFGNYQYQPGYQSDSSYPFPSYGIRPRGYHTIYANEYYFMGSANYAMPLFYPDIHIGSLANVQRIKANAFVDYATGSENFVIQNIYNSVGLEISADINIFRLQPLLEVGIRYSFIPETGSHELSPLIGTISF